MSKSYPQIEAAYTLSGGVWLPKGQVEEFGYSDGDEAEQRVAAAIAGCDDVSLFSRSLREHQVDWPSRYHLSASRANLLRPLSGVLSGRVLEVGSGCGAISRYLGELGTTLTALEGSQRRARMTASRCRDLPNVQVVNDVLENFVAEDGFDAVTLIGVLEYARVYGKAVDPAAAWLRKAYDLLADDGVLVVAIENQLGLKYLAGMPEDHVGKAMYGISDNYDDNTVATFGRMQLTRMLEAAGFEQAEFLLPFPDYKFPTAVVLPAGYDGSYPAFDASSLASQSASSDPQLPYAPLFSLERAWSVIGRNGLLADMANSFLIVARKQAKSSTRAGPVSLAHHFASERVPVFCKQVSFQASEVDGHIEVIRSRLAEDGESERSRPISMRLLPEEFVGGRMHCQALEAIVTRDGWRAAEVADWLMQWRDALLREVALSGDSTTAGMLPGWTLDALPRNLMRQNDGVTKFIDLEWVWHGDMELSYLIYRAIVGSFTSLVAVGTPEDVSHLHLPNLLRVLMQMVNAPIDERDVERFIDLDGMVTRLVYGRDSGLALKDFVGLNLRSLPDVGRMSRDWHAVVSDAAQRISAIAARVQDADADVTKAEQRAHTEVEALRSKFVETIRVKDMEIQSLLDSKAELDLQLKKANTTLEGVFTLANQTKKLEARISRDLIQAEDALGIYRESLRLASQRAEELDRMLTSTSWRITKPLRVMKRLLHPVYARQAAGRIARAVYRALPVSESTRQSIRTTSFRLLPSVLGSTHAYQSWLAAQQSPAADGEVVRAGGDLDQESTLARYTQKVLQLPGTPKEEYVGIAAERDPRADAARVIAFYLPQFHPFAENDQWWGRGFTEWTNVSKAVPQFVGHYQPHLPGELGFYDLRLVDVMRRQAELAKLYGIEGFCFHYYWFAGKRLMERPLNQLLESDIDLPFCICWANENWTRRWDGLENDILIAQDYSPQDDKAFIAELEPLLRDPRYIRVDGRPLIILYRPSLLPDAAATLERWRQHCRDAGIGEIFLCMVQFDKLDPREYGFDAAVEFPPHKVAAGLPSINESLEIVNPGFTGNVVDYADVVKSAFAERQPPYDLIRGVFPGWDNDARKPGRGYTVARSTPERYRTWLRGAIDYSRRNPVRGESLVFVNAWNEWAEGAHLEPDRRYGYAYLEATRQALRHAPAPSTPDRVVVIIHAFYPELLPEMLEYLSSWTVPYRLIISTIESKVEDVNARLIDAGIVAEVQVYENHGRDILPFLESLKTLGSSETLVLKLHTKRSLHREDGEAWRRDMLEKLLDPAIAMRIFEAFREQPQLGLAAPEGHILPMTTYWGANADAVHRLSRQMYSDPVNPAIAMFAAGSMFYVRVEAIRSIMDLHLGSNDFEAEAGQVDGTLAHAIERCFSISTCSSGYFIASSSSPQSEAYGSFEAYAYAQPTPGGVKNWS